MARKRRYGILYGKKLEMLRFGEQTAIYVIIAVAVLLFVLGVSKVSGHSMEPTLSDGQPVIYARIDRNYKKGDIVSVRMPSDEYLVKRVVAVAGDTVEIKNGVVYVNGTPEKNRFGSTPTPDDSAVKYPLTLTEGQIFVLGDNREVSVDSRNFGPISKTQTRGQILFVR